MTREQAGRIKDGVQKVAMAFADTHGFTYEKTAYRRGKCVVFFSSGRHIAPAEHCLFEDKFSKKARISSKDMEVIIRQPGVPGNFELLAKEYIVSYCTPLVAFMSGARVQKEGQNVSILFAREHAPEIVKRSGICTMFEGYIRDNFEEEVVISKLAYEEGETQDEFLSDVYKKVVRGRDISLMSDAEKEDVEKFRCPYKAERTQMCKRQPWTHLRGRLHR